MSFLSDAWDYTTDKVEDAWDATGAHVVDAAESVVRAVPGGDELIEAAGDFARTPVGMVVLRAMTTMWYGSVAWAIGPQLASVTFAIPGVMRGDRFDEAWLTEFKWRVEKTAEILGPGIVDAFGSQLTGLLRSLLKDIGVGRLIETSVQEFARRYGVREDVAAFAMALWNRVQLPPRDAFDPATGRQVREWGASARAQQLSDAQQKREHVALYGAREHEVLLGDRERAVLARLSEPEAKPTSKAGTIALVVVGLGALVAWRRGLL